MSGNFERAPRIWSQINRTNVNSIMHADISKNGSCQSSRFELTVSTSDNATDTQWQNPAGGKVGVTIFMRMRQDVCDTVIFEGLADSITTDLINGTTRIVGRDYSSVLVSSTYQNSFVNQTSSDIANFIGEQTWIFCQYCTDFDHGWQLSM